MTLSNELIDNLLADYKKPEDLIGERPAQATHQEILRARISAAINTISFITFTPRG
jgi:hypothetical protein